ncbi:hypothetical protein KC799_01550 [candidate division KSB1 bacterium]|nr:hypothetical protein [candidate division KSB1 bacterium]
MESLWLVNIFWLGILTFILLIFVLVLAFKIYSKLDQIRIITVQRSATGTAQGGKAGDDPNYPPPIPPPTGGGGG